MGKYKRNITIALLLDQISSPFESSIWHSVVQNAKKHNHNVQVFIGQQLGSAHRDTKEENIIYNLVNKEKIDGIIISSGTLKPIDGSDFLQFTKKYCDIPAVSISIEVEGMNTTIIDNFAGMVELVEHQITEHNAKKLAFVKGPDDNAEAVERYEAYLQALKNHSIPLDKEIVFKGDFKFEKGKEAVQKLKKLDRFDTDVIVCCNDDTARGVIDELRSLGIKVPSDIGVVGFDNNPGVEYLKPSLSTVDQPLDKMIEVSYNNIINQIEEKKCKSKEIIPARMVARESCGCIPFVAKESSQLLLNQSTKQNNRKLVVAESSILKKDLTKEMLKELKRSYPSDNSSKDSAMKFFKTLNHLVTTNVFEGTIELDWTNLILQLQIELAELYALEIDKKRLDDHFKIASGIVGDIYNSKQGHSQKLRNDKDLYHREFKHDLNYVITLSECVKVVTRHLEIIGLNKCYMVLYDGKSKRVSNFDWDIPANSRLIMAYENGNTIVDPDNEIIFKTANHLPDQFINRKEQTILATTALYDRKEQYGYLVYDLNLTNDDYYLTLQEYLCSTLSHIFLWQRRDLLEKENKETLNKLQESNNKLTDLDDMKNDFIANITHDFRSPLSIILNNADIGRKYEDDENCKEINIKRYNTIYNASEKLKDAIDRLLDLAKMDSEGLKLNVNKVQPKKFLSKLTDFYRSSVLSSKIKIIDSLPFHEIDNFFTDIDKLEEILNNIISNAIKYISSEDGEIIIHLDEDDNNVTIKIEDNGIGIEKEKLETIFNRFEQVEGGRNSLYKGTGLGLAYAKQLTGFLKGKIYAESEGLNCGTTFILTFKKGKDHFEDNAEIVNELSEIKLSEKISNSLKNNITEKLNIDNSKIEKHITDLNNEDEFDSKKGIILIIDDNPEIRDIEMTYLKKNGYKNFITAADGYQGINAAYKYRPDFILCDYNMPKKKGDEFHDELITNPDFKKIPLVFATALADRSLLIDRQRKGAVAYLGKPIIEDELITTVDIHITKYMEYKEIVMQATIDELTTINNRRNVMKLFSKKLAIRNLRDISLIFFDIDFFKVLNDTYGHQLGDRVLKEFGEIIKRSVRRYDIAGRYGGEEFIIVLPDTSKKQAIHVAKKLEKEIDQSILVHKDKEIKYSASFGICSLFADKEFILSKLKLKSLDEIYKIDAKKETDWSFIKEKKIQLEDILIEMADQAQYHAKSTICKECGYKSEKAINFADNQCPKCNSKKLIQGRNKIVSFPDKIVK